MSLQNKYDVKWFYENYPNKNKFSNIQLGIKDKKGKGTLTLSMYKKIIITYLDVYFKDLYFSKNKSYFFLTGILSIKRVAPKLIKGVFKEETVILYWEKRPSRMYIYNVEILKLKGGTSRMGKLDKLFFNIFGRNNL